MENSRFKTNIFKKIVDVIDINLKDPRKQASHQNEAVPRANLRKCVPHGRKRRCRVLYNVFSIIRLVRASSRGWTGEGGVGGSRDEGAFCSNYFSFFFIVILTC